MPCPQKFGWTESGPKNPTLPQLTPKLVPTRLPSTSAAKLPEGPAGNRGRPGLASPRKLRGSGSPRKVPKARRRILSAAGRSVARNGRISTSVFALGLSAPVSNGPHPAPSGTENPGQSPFLWTPHSTPSSGLLLILQLVLHRDASAPQ